MHNAMPKSFRSMVTTPHYLASQVGNATLERGGNAVDASVAISAALAVVYPHMTGLGGDAFFLIYSAEEGRVVGLNGSGRSAAAADPGYYRALGYERLPDRGVESALTVPGMVDAWREVWSRYGKLPWEALLEPAIGYAERGFPISRDLRGWMLRDEALLRADVRLAALFLDPATGRPKPEGARLVQRDLASSLRAVATGGREIFYRGDLMRRVVAAIREDGGELAEEDFRAHRSEWVDPISVAYRGREVYQMPPNSQGFSLLMMLNMLETIELAAIPRGSAEFYHVAAEAVKRAFSYRDAYLGDPDFVSVPLARLLSKELGEELATGFLGGTEPVASPFASVPMGQDTAYAAVVDERGNAVSFIQSLYYDFGSGYVAGDTGIILQNRGSYFSLREGHPNELAPGKRTFHTLMPGMALKDGKPCLLMGTQGGEGQPQTQLSLVTGVLDYKCTIQEAIGLPRWVYGRTWGEGSDVLKIEDRGVEAERLRAMGHAVELVEAWDGVMGQAQGIAIGEDGVLSGAADPRGDGLAIGR